MPVWDSSVPMLCHEMKRNISQQSRIYDFLLIASYVSKIADKIHISEKKSNLGIEKGEDTI